jgi:hypothetical protein
VIATNAIENPIWENRIVWYPMWMPRFSCPFACTNMDSKADPSTISGTAMARKITKFRPPRPLNE